MVCMTPLSVYVCPVKGLSVEVTRKNLIRLLRLTLDADTLIRVEIQDPLDGEYLELSFSVRRSSETHENSTP